MTKRQARINMRNLKIKRLYDKLLVSKQEWRNDAIINEVATTFYLSPRTIEAILRGEGNY